jgi:prophage regulatory protein
MSFKILRLPEVVKLTGLGRSTIYAKISAGEFPKPIRLGVRAVGWADEDVYTWLTSKRIDHRCEHGGSDA